MTLPYVNVIIILQCSKTVFSLNFEDWLWLSKLYEFIAQRTYQYTSSTVFHKTYLIILIRTNKLTAMKVCWRSSSELMLCFKQSLFKHIVYYMRVSFINQYFNYEYFCLSCSKVIPSMWLLMHLLWKETILNNFCHIFDRRCISDLSDDPWDNKITLTLIYKKVLHKYVQFSKHAEQFGVRTFMLFLSLEMY